MTNEIKNKKGEVIFTYEQEHLNQADLSKANLFRAELVEAYLVGAELVEADLHGAELVEAEDISRSYDL